MLADALAHLQGGRPQDASPLLEAQVQRHPADARAWFLLGACRHALKDLPAATVAFSRAVAHSPGNLEAHLALSSVAREAGDAQAALSACDAGLQCFPGESRLFHARALALEALGRTNEALSAYDGALRLAPSSGDVLHDRSLLLARLGRLEEAERSYRAYVGAHPASVSALAGLADVLLAQRRYEEVVRLVPVQLPETGMQVRRGLAFASLGRLEEARQAFSSARSRDPEGVSRFVARATGSSDVELTLSPENIFLARCYAALCECDWSAWEPMIAEARRCISAQDTVLEPAVGFMVRFLPLTGAERRAIAARIAARIEASAPLLPAPGPRQPRRIRVGVLSPDYREHLNAYLLLPLFELLDRRRFEVYAYSLSADDGSAARARVQAAADVFRQIHGASDEDAAMTIRADEIDVLLDAAGHTTGGRFGIVARRPARLHVNYLGFSCSLGSTRVDYAIVDPVAAGCGEEWSEALAQVNESFFLYDYRTPAPEASVTREQYGLPDHAFVYCAFHRAEKISPDVFELWAQVLIRTPHSVLWLGPLPPAALARLREQASARNIAPSRLVMAPFEPRYDPRYIARQRLGDLFLDSLHHNAMTTACDALGAGLPVLTLPGEAIAARAGASFLSACGLPEMIAANREEFIRIAVELAESPALLLKYRNRLRDNRATAALFDTAARIRDLEAAFERMLARAQRGEAPAAFHV